VMPIIFFYKFQNFQKNCYLTQNLTKTTNLMNPWHDLSTGKNAPQSVSAIIEIPKGSRAKYELDKDSGLLRLDRVLYSSVYYPANYGFIPQTYCDDNDPLDILVLSMIDIQPLCIVNAKVIGVMRMLDSGEADDKIIAVAADDVSINHINNIAQLPLHFINEMRSFFEDYKKLENKTVMVEEFLDRDVAHKIVIQAMQDYQNKIAPTHKK
jgi:inorganic pyrophosphatase